MDPLTGMRVFCAAVEQGSLAAAARRLGLSATMAGRYLDGLERGVQVRLMQRTTRRLQLTEAGQLYYGRCRRLLEEIDAAGDEVRELGSGPRGTLRVAAPVSFGSRYLGGPIARYMRAHPHVRVEMDLDDRYVDLLAREVDVAIRIGRLADSGLVARRLAPCRMVVCASPSYLERQGCPRSPEELSRHRRLAFNLSESPGNWTFVDALGRASAVEGPAALRANNMQLLSAAALEGAGVVYGPLFVFAEYLREGTLVPLLPEYKTVDLDVHAVLPSTRYLPLKVRRFVDQLVEEFATTAPWEAASG